MRDYWPALLICLLLLAPVVPEFLARFSTFSGKRLRVFWEDFHRTENRWYIISSSPTDTTLSSLSLLSFGSPPKNVVR
jgi:hypothetical protein